jgi:hypothetical protein
MGAKNAKRSLGPAIRKGVEYVYYDIKRDQLSIVMRGELTSAVLEESDCRFQLYRNKYAFRYMRAVDLEYLGVL